jgi:hypothetical protein
VKNFDRKGSASSFRCWAVAASLMLAAGAPAVVAEVAEIQISAAVAHWQIQPGQGGSTLKIHDEGGVLMREASFAPGVAPTFQPAADGIYRWSLAVAPLLTGQQRAELEAARERGGPAPAGIPAGALLSGRLVMKGGLLHDAGGLGAGAREPAVDEVIPQNLYVIGNLCAGPQCVNEEDLGTDTLRLKSITTRLKFEDASTITGFPSNDWQLTANDPLEGGDDFFSLEDVTGSLVPFTVMAGAPDDSIFVESSGKVGFGTATPAFALHARRFDTPGLRLEQDSTLFPDQLWDIFGNEQGLFVVDATNGGLPLRIHPGSAINSLVIDPTGLVGIGTGSPAKKLHVVLGSATNDVALRLENNEAVKLEMVNTSTAHGGSATTWFLQSDNDPHRTFKISKFGGGGPVVTIGNRANANGTTFTVDGSVAATSFITTSSRAAKTDEEAVEPSEVLEKLAGLEIGKWRFKSEAEGVRHLGPYAEDFKQAFGLGQSDQSIELQDASGVALVAIQALYQEVQELKKKNAELERRLDTEN